MSYFDVGDLVKDHFEHIFIVTSLNKNRDNRVYSVSLCPIVADTYTMNKGSVSVFPTDVYLLNGDK